jgi:triacylglycerol lipase
MSTNLNDSADSADNAAPPETTGPVQSWIDPGKTKALADASLAAYNYFEGLSFTAPAGFRTYAGFTGWDDWFWSVGRVEKFGLIFQSLVVPTRFIVAFRGTDSDSDALEDAFFYYSTFKPYRNAANPLVDDVSAGFNGIYSTKGSTMTYTMQQQVFDILLHGQMTEVYITGHSLGGALSQLFTLDMCVSFPNVRVETINFASPRVGGKEHWAVACANAGVPQKMTRVINYWDYVPDLPVTIDIFDQYTSIGAEFRTAFYGPGSIFTDELPRHRLLNLQTVLNNCLGRTPQVWTGTFADAVNHGYIMTSTAPPTASKEELLAKLRELQELERSTRAETGYTEPST